MRDNKTYQNYGLRIMAKALCEGGVYYALYFIVKILSFLPFKVLYVLSDILYYPLYYVIRYRRHIARRNLIEAFPNKSLDEIIRIEKKFYRFFMDMVLESAKLLSASSGEIAKHMEFPNIDMVNKLLSEGKSISAFLGHFGNWEWLSTTSLHTIDNAEIVLVYHKLRNKATDRLIKKLRQEAGSVCVDMYQTVRFMAKKQSEKHPCMIGFIADQSPKKREVKHFLWFLNHNVPVLTGTEKTTKHFGYEALFASMKRVERGHYRCYFHTLHPDPKSLPDFELTSLYYKRLEKEIEEAPEYYLWTHNRFKHAEHEQINNSHTDKISQTSLCK